MEKGQGAHILVVPCATQGHINPILQFSKRLVSKGLKVTLAITNFISKTALPNINSGTVQIDTISDGFDQGGFAQAESIQAYVDGFALAGSRSLAEVIKKYETSPTPIDCVIYDGLLPWALDVTKQLGLVGVCFLTQSCAVNYIYYCVQKGMLSVPVDSTPVSMPGLPVLELRDMPSFMYVYGTYPAYFESVLSQFENVNKADYVFVNSFYELEAEVVDALSNVIQLLTIGPTIPSFYLDKRVDDDNDYGLNLFPMDSTTCINWLSTKPEGSVVYISFGSMANLDTNHMEELAWGIKSSNGYFLWVVRASEEAKIPKNFLEETSSKGLVISWCPQLKVLSDKAIGCFLTHGGWNSTIEALSLGVPMVVMPQWTDQTTNAKFVQDVWKVGVRVKVDENGVVGREEIEGCVRQVLEGEMGKELKKNAVKWKELAVEAVNEGGTSDNYIDDFVSRFTKP